MLKKKKKTVTEIFSILHDLKVNDELLVFHLYKRFVCKPEQTHPESSEHYMQVKCSGPKDSSHVQWECTITQASFSLMYSAWSTTALNLLLERRVSNERFIANSEFWSKSWDFIRLLPSQIMGSIVKTWPGFITPTALFSTYKHKTQYSVRTGYVMRMCLNV